MLVHDVKWLYPRPVTTLAVLVVAVAATLLSRALLPDRWRPDGLAWVVPAALVAYASHRLLSFRGWAKGFKHTVLDWFGGDVDDAQTWLFAGLSGGAALVAVAALQRWASG
jgi:hypothetical protein